MALPFGVSWLCSLLLWVCIGFTTQKGYNTAHGYSLDGDDFGSDESGPRTQTSNMFDSGEPLFTNQESVSPRDEMQALRRHSFISLQGEPENHENNEDFSSVTGLSEDVVQNKPDSEHVPAPPVQKYEHKGAGNQHPFGLLVDKHTQEKPMEGTSFQTVKDFKWFTEKLKSSFFIPGGAFGPHFQTARETLKNEMAANAQNIKGETDMGYRSNYTKEVTAHDDASENEVWSEAMNTAFEQNENGANYQMPGENPSVPDPDDSTESLTYSSVYDNQNSGPGSALYPSHPEHVSGNYGSFDNFGENPDISASYKQNENFQSKNFNLPEQIPSGSYYGDDLYFGGYVTAPPVSLPYSPSQDLSYYSSQRSNIMPLTSKVIQQPKYASHTGGFELGEDFQSEELGRGNSANDLSAPMPRSLNSYAKSLHVNPLRGQYYIQYPLPKRRESPAQPLEAYQPTENKQSKAVNHSPTAHLLVSSGSVSSSSDNIMPKRSSGHVGVQTSSPHDAQPRAFNKKQPVRFHRLFTRKPFSLLQDSSGHGGYLRDQTVDVSPPFNLTAKDREKSNLSQLNQAADTQGPKRMADNSIIIPISSGLDSTQSGISSWARDDVHLNSLTNLAPTSASEKAYSRFFGNDIHGVRNPQGLYSNPLRRGLSAKKALQTSIKPNKEQQTPANVNKEPRIVADLHLKPLSASKVSDSTFSDVFWRNGGHKKRLPSQMGPNRSPPFVKAYVHKSRNDYKRKRLSLSKTHYSPYRLDEYKNNVYRNVKDLKNNKERLKPFK
ncbi:uncharacterized protein [Notothenia coriiceps]|uniref:Uncharacterized protein LOC104940835 n=1 Tax=Notothenia coriiceps TaxID=8208 RepID=A0A6I9MRR3_9TELE|nr:PREDICTED: uncharacterized protein LOC104940835 [Notothenia coriiceps]XP_010764126.1 PREDICTED: uncharacterized protein LOC104940835 [Notothenia coriiceps]